MKTLNKYLTHIAIFIFILLFSFLYGFIVQLNPIPPLNVVLWIGYCYMIWKLTKSYKYDNNFKNKALICISLIFSIYITYLTKSAYYVAHFNEIYLFGTSNMIPKGFEEGLFNALIDLGALKQKLLFLLSWDSLSISFGSNLNLSLGIVITNILRVIEIIGIALSPLIYSRILESWRSKSK